MAIDENFLEELNKQIQAKQQEIIKNQQEFAQLKMIKQYWDGYCAGYKQAEKDAVTDGDK